MLSRIRGAIDARIAEEQARQRATQESVSRSNSARRANRSPARRPSTRVKRGNSFLTKSPDPSEFDAEFVVGDDDSSTRTSTPLPEMEKSTEGGEPDNSESVRATPPPSERPTGQTPSEMPMDLTLKGDMVVDELKRVTADRDEFKKKLEAAEASTREAWDEVANLKRSQPIEESTSTSDGEPVVAKELPSLQTTSSTGENSLEDSQKSPTTSITSRAASIRGLFSPKAKPIKSPPPQEENEEFFSFENEIPKLESELKEKENEIESLKAQVKGLTRDLSVARESTEGMVHSLETATREVSELRDKNDRLDASFKAERHDLREQIISLESRLRSTESELVRSFAEMDSIRSRLETKTNELQEIKDTAESQQTEIDGQKSSDQKRFDVLQGVVTNLKSQLKDAESTIQSLKHDLSSSETKAKKAQDIVDFVDSGLDGNENWKQAKELVLNGRPADFQDVRMALTPQEQQKALPTTSANNVSLVANGGKKKNKKKKKGGKADPEKEAAASTAPEQISLDGSPNDAIRDLETTVNTLSAELTEKSAAIDRLHAKLKGEENLCEEIESLREDLMNIGQDHVEAKDRVKELVAEKVALEKTIAGLEEEIVTLKANSASATDAEKAHKDLMTEFQDLKTKAVALETDLSVAQQLAASRFKDLTDLRQALQKVQPELRNLRQESVDLKTTREELKAKTSELVRLERKQEDLRMEVKDLKVTIGEKDAEVKTLNQKITQETNSRLEAERALGVAQSDLRYSEGQKQEAIEKNEHSSKNLLRTQEELRSANAKLRELEEQISKLNREVGGLHDEIQLKAAQHASAQSLMNSMRDQTSEMAMQIKEVRERCESLEEELADAQRLLSERTREGETMRRLLSEVELRAEHKVRDFKERLETAIEERDRAEDEANIVGRRRAREMEELKTKVRDAERELRRAEEDREELDHAQKEWKRRREELETETERSRQELADVKAAMSQLRDALDESERQTREFDKERSELRRSIEETNQHLEKLKRTNKTLSEELKSIQSGKGRIESGNRTPRSSIDSGMLRGVTSPSSRTRNPSRARNETPTGPGAGSIDHVYLKNVLLQFLEQKDKHYQKQLIPVLGMLLHFDANDEQRWMSAISSK
ncbi:predicted protein [Uncinocarpus reesii 1704]|uniref:GRIP domain-containing protein n=1 Tax=Uncinocarpus reesii (strain UAMH 1704) TaxID=336963 RepID=C4JI52_UNCRE|nr:uncharacterized protein UREG_02798 [Uncinocarpus reesii 1704]EEP77949.1 predicted protein [Uncinocarpus reesii 1704]